MIRSASVLLLMACSSRPTVTAADGAAVVEPLPEEVDAAPDWLPQSVSTVTPTDVPAASIAIQNNELIVNGWVVVHLADGRVPDEDRRGQLIAPAYERLLSVSESAREMSSRFAKTDPRPISEFLVSQIHADRDTSFETLLQVMYTAGQAQFSEFELAVRGTTPDAPVAVIPVQLPQLSAPGDPVDDRPQVVIVIDANGYEVSSTSLRAGPADSRVLQMLEGRDETTPSQEEAPIAAEPARVDCDPAPCNDADAYDATTLASRVQSLRTDAYGPLVILVPDSNTPYQVLIHAADAALAAADTSGPVQLVVAGGTD